VTDGPDPDGEPQAEPYVKGFEQLWEQMDGIEALVKTEADRQPIDEFLWALTCHLRRLLGSTHIRLDSNFPDDTRMIGEDEREAVREALALLAEARHLVIGAVGEDRIVELEHQDIERLREQFDLPDPDDPTD